MTYRVPFARRGSVVDERDLQALTEVVQSGEALSSGSCRDRFEAKFRDFVGAKHALSVTSGTVALEIAIRLLDLQPGDEVIATPQTYQASVQPLLARQVTVRFCDVDPQSLNLDPVALRELLTPRTKGIILVHYGGYPAEMAEIMGIARRRGIPVIEDCAHALGARYHGRRPGALGDIGCFSFHTSKNITTLGEGGMITLNRDAWAKRVDRIRSNEVDGTYAPAGVLAGRAPRILPWMKFSAGVYQDSCRSVAGAGTNATMSEAAAAVGVVQLDKLPALTERRRWIASRLDEVLEGYPGVRFHRPPPGLEHAQHLYTFFMPGGPDVRYELVRALDERGVEIQLRYFPQHLLPEWRLRGHSIGECPVAERLWFSSHVNLPCHPGLTDAQVDYLVEALYDALSTVGGTRNRSGVLKCR
ncbi:perosamine synthetase [Amycolatopsis bartoniae]|uniref:Spore coat polysaccharide biosynthesis protein SpsC n=1 Tax=Amycolatopsis bartoniae TaxID=941986 RepID=A0A8H9IYM9_9PSEU|nr:DegT/DnrJ/EryC1/StrS family aminotransferase [Amycolatopsis bartoniae]MBB2937341.1 perosamine synthetase [Amycolatopsis bartoniae]TVT07974.1 DegT/DnrJ/EryC1/StrS family aminotransferase [Amycolatopsis bartoniae]GHF78308.1 spore coat polysaccharide biosynthesis protein SpsC [Amycolatopsis bartoniae]